MMLEALGAISPGNLEEPNGSGFYTGAGDGPSCRSAQILYLNGQAVYLMATSTGLYTTDSLQPYTQTSTRCYYEMDANWHRE